MVRGEAALTVGLFRTFFRQREDEDLMLRLRNGGRRGYGPVSERGRCLLQVENSHSESCDCHAA